MDGNDHEKALCEMIYALGDNNPTALAVMDRYKKDGFLPEREWSAKTAIHFSSAKKWSLAAFEDKGTYILGAAEFILGDAMTDALRTDKDAVGGRIQSYIVCKQQQYATRS